MNNEEWGQKWVDTRIRMPRTIDSEFIRGMNMEMMSVRNSIDFLNACLEFNQNTAKIVGPVGLALCRDSLGMSISDFSLLNGCEMDEITTRTIRIIEQIRRLKRDLELLSAIDSLHKALMARKAATEDGEFYLTPSVGMYLSGLSTAFIEGEK